MNRVLGAVLAGGASSRFGSDKALAVIGGQTLLDRARAALAPFVAEVVVVGRAEGVPDLPRPALGPLGGIAGALDQAARRGFGSVVTIGCDMPEVPEELLAAVLAQAPAYCADAPVLGHWPANAAAALLEHLSRLPASDTLHRRASDRKRRRSGAYPLSVRHWATSIGAVAIPSHTPLRNVNTPADLPS